MNLFENLVQYTLDNGLRVILKQLRFSPLVSVWAWYHAGSKNEFTGTTGVSHWVEHMNFKGTDQIPKSDIKSMIERKGGFWNGYTFIDQTTYMETLGSEGLDTALYLESQRMCGSLFDTEEVATERSVIVSELQGNENDPGELLDREVTAAAFRAHPYKWPVIGWQSDIETMTREDLYSYYRNYYSPDNAIIVVVGDFELDEAKLLIEKHYSGIEKWQGTRRAVNTVEPPQRGERRVTVRREGTTPLLQISYHAPAFTNKDFAALSLFDAILAGPCGLNIFSGFSTSAGRSSRLYREVIEGNLAAATGTSLLPTEHPYLFSIWAMLKREEDFSKVENVIFQTIEDIIHRPVDKTEVEKAKTQILAKRAFELEGITNVGHQLGYYSIIGALDALAEFGDNLRNMTIDDAREAARSYLGADNRTVGHFLPIQAGGVDNE